MVRWQERAKRRADREAAEVAAQEVMEWLEEGDGDSRLQEPLRHDRLPMEVLAQKMSEEYERGERLVRNLHVLDHLIQAHEGSLAVHIQQMMESLRAKLEVDLRASTNRQAELLDEQLKMECEAA